MTKSKSNAMVRLPREQRCRFLIGPVTSWFMPRSVDIWTQPTKKELESGPKGPNSTSNDLMECDNQEAGIEEARSLSYFVYGSIGCFCYGEIHYNKIQKKHEQNITNQESFTSAPSAIVNHLIDIKEDNSRVACVRFLKQYRYPLLMILTESGSFLLHDCMTGENLVHYKKSELFDKYIKPYCKIEDNHSEEHSHKKTKFNVIQQINSCSWPVARNAFLGVSLLREKTNILFWLKFKDLINGSTKDLASINKTNFIESCVKLDLDLPQFANPICCMESAMLNADTCLVAVGMDDGLIIIVKINFNDDQAKRVIKLARHNDQISSMSLCTMNTKKFPLGLLASVSRNGLTLIWDIENEFYFADYQAAEGFKGGKINWFALSFLPMPQAKRTFLAVSNPESGINVLEIPENARSKIRLNHNNKTDSKDNSRQKGRKFVSEQTIKHHGLVFNMTFDEKTCTMLTTSLDGNKIFWSCKILPSAEGFRSDKKAVDAVDIKPEFLYPTMANNSRTHMLRFSPIREDFIGAALGKAGVKFYKISNNPANSRYDMSTSCAVVCRRIQKANLSPTSLAWHPSHEYRVAIGTIEGKVVRADLVPNKPAILESEFPQNSAGCAQRNSHGGDVRMQDAETDDLFGVEYKPMSRTNDDHSKSGDPVSTGNHQNPSKTDGVYSLCWGPNPTCPEDTSRLAVYAVGSVSKRLFIYYTAKEPGDRMIDYLDEFHDRSLPEAQSKASEVAWKSSMDLMALGTTDGKVIIVKYLEDSHEDRSCNKLFKKLAVIDGPLGSSHIQCLAWHPTTDDTDARYYYLAASANESAAYVFSVKESLLVADVKSQLRLGARPATSNDAGNSIPPEDRSQTITTISVYSHKLDAHKRAITDIVWNPHDPDLLATSSFDRCCYVWSLDRSLELELREARILSKFQARDRLFTLEWSLLDTDLIFTSGQDSTIWAWRPSENPMKSTSSVTLE